MKLPHERISEVPENNELIPQAVLKVQTTVIELANRHLEHGDPLHSYIVEYYSDTKKLEFELGNVLRGLDEARIDAYIAELKQKFSNPAYFIERFERMQERGAAKERMKERYEKDPLATPEEYDAGIYREGIESQVVDAVFELRKKGYDTFQSGFTEKDPRDQYIDFYNKEVTVPDELAEEIEALGFEITLLKLEDRTTIKLHPTEDTPVRLDTSKNIWDVFASKIPPAKKEGFRSVQTYELKKRFREIQDGLRRSA